MHIHTPFHPFESDYFIEGIRAMIVSCYPIIIFLFLVVTEFKFVWNTEIEGRGEEEVHIAQHPLQLEVDQMAMTGSDVCNFRVMSLKGRACSSLTATQTW